MKINYKLNQIFMLLGNSYVESTAVDGLEDELLTLRHYERTPEQTAQIGLLPADANAQVLLHTLQCLGFRCR